MDTLNNGWNSFLNTLSHIFILFWSFLSDHMFISFCVILGILGMIFIYRFSISKKDSKKSDLDSKDTDKEAVSSHKHDDHDDHHHSPKPKRYPNLIAFGVILAAVWFISIVANLYFKYQENKRSEEKIEAERQIEQAAAIAAHLTTSKETIIVHPGEETTPILLDKTIQNFVADPAGPIFIHWAYSNDLDYWQPDGPNEYHKTGFRSGISKVSFTSKYYTTVVVTITRLIK